MLHWSHFVTAIIFAVNILALEASNTWENSQYKRAVDLSRAYIKESITISATNKADIPLKEYTFSVNDGFNAFDEVSIISFLEADRGIAIEFEEIEPKSYKLELPFPIAPKNELNLKIQYAYRGAILPLPVEIGMSQVQTLLIKLNKFAFSPYPTKDYSLSFSGVSKGQEMEIQFVDDSIITPDLPHIRPKIEDKTLVYGPLDFTLEPFTVKPMGLVYDHNRPLARVINLERSVWIPASNVPKLPVEESYELTNDGARLDSGFLRVDWLKGRYETTRNHWALSHLEFPLSHEGELQDFYYKDLVGVVSTSTFIQNRLFLQPRFPLFGGWNFNFTLGWNYLIQDFIHQISGAEDTYIARVPIVNSARDVSYDNVYLNFYLPENAEFLNVSSPINFELINVDKEYSYLDVEGGHTKITLHYRNLFDEVTHLDAFVLYKNTNAGYLTRIFKVAGFLFIALTSYYFLTLLDFSLHSNKELNKEKETVDSS